MKLKALLVAGAVCLASAVNSSAADNTVFSANTVGFVNKEIPTGFSMIANPVVAADNSIAALFPDATLGWQVFKFDPGAGTFSVFSVGFTGWGTDAQTTTLLPGEGAFVNNPGAPFTVTFTGEVVQGAASNMEIAGGFSIVSSTVAQGGLLQTDLGFPATLGDQIFKFNNGTGSYEVSSFGFTGWGVEPSVEIAESFFVNKAATVNWDRNFDPNSAQ